MRVSGRTRTTIGRGVELDAIKELLVGLDEGPRGLFLVGPPGIGKTQLWLDGVEFARGRGVRVSTTRPAEADAHVAFSALRDLVGDAAEEVLAELPEPQRRALAITLFLEEPGAKAPEPDAISAAFVGALRLLARPQPLLVAVDDAQWLDASSHAVLAFALRRLEDDRVGVLATVRVEGGVDVDDLLVALPSELTERRDLAPLTVAALYELVRERYGLSLARPTLLRLHELAGGNPFFALEIARGGLSENEQLTVPRGLAELLRARLGALSEPTRDVLLCAAALARPTREVLEQVDEGVDAALAEAVVAEIVESEHGVIRFTHPLFGSVHYSGAEVAARRGAHGRLAKADLDPEERARHFALAAAGPDEEVAQALDAAVSLARGRGALASAAELAELALAITPPTSPARHARSLAAADLTYWSGAVTRAELLLAEALERSVGDHERAEILLKLGRLALETDQAKAASVLSQAVYLTGDDAALRSDVLAHLAVTVWGDWDAAMEYAAEAVNAAESAGDRRALADALAVLGQAQYLRSGNVPKELMQRAVALELSTGHVSVESGATESYGGMLLDVWDLGPARDIFEQLVARARAEDDSALTYPLEKLAFVELCAGNLDRAVALAREAADVAAQGGRLHAEMYAFFRLGWIEALRGDVDLARQTCDRSLRLAEQTSGFVRGARLSLGYLESSLENYEAAWSYLDPTNPQTGTMTPDRPVVHVPEAVEVLAALRRPDDARALLGPFEKRAEALHRDWAVAAAAHCRALILAAGGDLSGAEAAAAGAAALAEANGFPLALGRALLALGSIQRRRRRKADARATLERAAAVFEELGAKIWLERARKELRRIGGRSAPAGDALSATEAEIARLVVAGRTNSEVAQELHLSAKTVEWNLSKIYRKLGVRSRTELAARFPGG